jgi:hypothetical protein
VQGRDLGECGDVDDELLCVVDVGNVSWSVTPSDFVSRVSEIRGGLRPRTVKNENGPGSRRR